MSTRYSNVNRNSNANKRTLRGGDRRSWQVIRYEMYINTKPGPHISDLERRRYWAQIILDIRCARKWIYKGAIEQVHSDHVNVYKVSFSHMMQTITFYDMSGVFVYQIVEGVYGMTLVEIERRRDEYLFAKRESSLSSKEIKYLRNTSKTKL